MLISYILIIITGGLILISQKNPILSDGTKFDNNRVQDKIEYSKHVINAVCLMLEDLNRDGEDELLINIRWNADEGRYF